MGDLMLNDKKLSYDETYEKIKKEYKEWKRNPNGMSEAEFFKKCEWSKRQFFNDMIDRRDEV